jgi:hypothetical protein
MGPKAVNEFLQNDLLSQADPTAQSGTDSAPDPDVKARTLLERAAARVSKRFAGQPLIESEIQDTMAHAYEGLGLYAESEQHLRRAYELSASHRGPDAPETLDMLMALSGRLMELNKYADAVRSTRFSKLANRRFTTHVQSARLGCSQGWSWQPGVRIRGRRPEC